MPWLLPGYGQQAVLDLKEGAGSDTGVALNPFVSLRTRLTAQEDVPMFRARTTQRERWRLMVYDRFDGTDFAASSDPRADLVAFQGPIPGEQDPDLPVTQVTQEVEIQELGSFWLPAATTPVRVDAGRPVLANETFASLTINRRLREGFSYTVVSQVPDIEAADLDGPVDYRDYPEMKPYTETGTLDREVRAIGPRRWSRPGTPTPPSRRPWPSRTTCAARSSATTWTCPRCRPAATSCGAS